MGTQENLQSGEGSDRGDDRAADYALNHADRLHVTLDNLEDLADIDAAMLPFDGGLHDVEPGADLHLPGAPASPTSPPVPETQPDAPFPVPRPPAEPGPAAPPPPAPPPAWVVPVVPPRARRVPVELPVRTRAGWARPAERWLLEVLALALASGAFVAPSVWLLAVAAVCLVVGMVVFLTAGQPLGSLPGRFVRRGIALLRPASLLWVPVMTARSLLAAALLPAGVAAVIWVAGHGTTGVIAAARAGAWADGFRVGAVLVCVLMVTSVGDGRHSRSAAVRRWVTDIPDGVLVTVALICCTVTLLVVVTAPHPTDSFASKADGLGWLPSAARTPADRVRDDIVTTELDALASCLADRSETPWQTDYTNDNPLDEPDVARLIVGGEPTGAPPGDLMTAIIAAHNQLAPWVETIAVQWAGSERVRTDRETLPRRQPLTDPTIVVAATSVGRELLDAVSADRTTALRCSAGPVL